MQVKDIEIPYKISNSQFKLFCISCVHGGTIHCAESGIRAKVSEIAQTKNAYCITLGDMAEFITPGDKRFDPSQKAIADWVEPDNIAECQTEWVAKLLKPIKNKLIGMIFGNHENNFRKHNYGNVHQNICDRLGVGNLGYSCFVRLFFRRENSNETHIIKGCFTHGSGWAVTKGAKLNKLRQFMDSFEADIYGYGHMHDIITDTKPFMTITNRPFGKSMIKAHEGVGAVCGSWFRTYTQGITASYGETRTYPPTVIGCVVFTIDAHTGLVSVSPSR
ncbi:MAG: hypothetical protein DDT33_01413 [Firmicutes bacterium]|nr:hypothetical protein [Bacillota bacterium]